jgi:hypothetical protein
MTKYSNPYQAPLSEMTKYTEIPVYERDKRMRASRQYLNHHFPGKRNHSWTAYEKLTSFLWQLRSASGTILETGEAESLEFQN